METIVNNPTPQTLVVEKKSNSGIGLLIGAMILVGFLAVVLYFAIPAIKNMGPIQLNVPAINVPAPQVIVPDTVKVETTAPVPTQ